MKKIKLSNLIQEEIRVAIPFLRENEEDDYIEIKNPTEEIKTKLGNLIWESIEDINSSTSQEELLKFLFDNLTNIDLNIKLEEILNNNLSHEFNITVFHLTQILTEITNEVLMNASLQLSKIKTDKLKEDLNDQVKYIEENLSVVN